MHVKECLETLVRDGFILVFNQDGLDVVKTAEALLAAGFHTMEVTCRIRRPLEKIERLRRELPPFVVGAASLVDSPGMLEVYNRTHPDDPLPDVMQAADSGAHYLVSAANFRRETYEQFAGERVLIPGCGTTSEILCQFGWGANLCKIFPARQLGGAAFVQAIDPAIHRLVSLVPTGGTDAGNIPEYIAAGILVVGGSFGMIEKPVLDAIIAEQDYPLLARRLGAIRELIDHHRRQRWPNLSFADASLDEISRITGRQFNCTGGAINR